MEEHHPVLNRRGQHPLRLVGIEESGEPGEHAVLLQRRPEPDLGCCLFVHRRVAPLLRRLVEYLDRHIERC